MPRPAPELARTTRRPAGPSNLAVALVLATLTSLAVLTSGCQQWGLGGWNAGPTGESADRGPGASGGPAEGMARADQRLDGRVDFPPDRSAQAVASDVTNAATVTLVHTGTNIAIASTITRGDGSFSLNLGGFIPETGLAYLVEATKGLGSYRPGHDAPRFRTLVLFNGSAWQSISVPRLVINALTTAVAIESGLDPAGVPPAGTMGKVNVSGTSPGLNPTPAFTGHPDAELLRLAIDVVGSLSGDVDPVGAVSRLDPVVADVRPKSGKGGDLVAIEGGGFSPVVAGNTVKFAGTAATVLVATPVRLVVELPGNATSGPVSVETSRGSAPAVGPTFQVVTAAPVTISEIAPPHAATGSVVTIYGAGFRTTVAKNTAVFAKTGGGTVNGEIVAADLNSLAVRVPDSAASGLVQVSLPGDVTSNRAWFTVDTSAQTVLAAVVPNVGAPGQEVRFEGSGLGSASGQAVFGNYAGEVMAWSDSTVTAKAPPNTAANVMAALHGPFGMVGGDLLFTYLGGNPRQSGGETGEALGPSVLSANHAGGWYSVIGRYFYVGAGFSGSTAVARARMGDDGTLGEFEPVVARVAIPVFSTVFSNVDNLVVGNYAYVFGGIQPNVGPIDAIQVARVLTSDGASISNFVVSPVRLLRPIDGNSALKIGRYLYIFGNGWEGGGVSSEIQRISFDDTGLIQSVEKFAAAPASTRISSPWGQAVRVHRSDQGVNQPQDFVYLMGGGWPNARIILSAPVNPDGTLGTFTDTGKRLLRDFYAGSVYATDKAIFVFNGGREMCNVTKIDIYNDGGISNAACYATSGNELQYSAVARLGRHFYVVNDRDGGQRLRDFTIQ